MRWGEGVTFQRCGAPGSTGAGPPGGRFACACPATEAEGTFAASTQEARSVLLMSDGAERRIAAGDVFFATS